MSTNLPEQFLDFAPYVKWIHPTMEGRLELRLASTYDEMKELYDVMLPRIEEVLEFLDRYELGKIPEDAENLLYLSYSFLNSVSCVEYYHSTRIPMGIEHERLVMCDPSDFF